MAGRIMYDNYLRDASVVIHNGPAGYPPGNCVDGRTSTHFKVLSGANNGITYNLGSQKTFDTFCMSRHTLGSTAYLDILGSNNGVDYTSIVTDHNQSTQKNIYLSLGSQTYQYVQIAVFDASNANTWADWYIGPHLTLDRSQKHGFIRPGLSDGDKIISNVTRGKELAGLTLSEGIDRIVFKMPYYASAWLGEFLALRDVMKQYPIYVLWDDTRSEVPFTGGEPPFYCWPTSELPKPRYSKNITGYYDIVFDMSGFWS